MNTNKNTNNNKISIKVVGEENRVLKALGIIEKEFPLSVRSKIMDNDDGLTVRCWLTVALEA
ncbi:MAG: hypothetical protein ABSB71_09935 [Candidatus Bathyarchaeia archaeon]